MSSKAMSLKGKIKNYAKNNNIAAQVVLQNYTLCLNSSQLGYDRCEKIIMECSK